jgi:hypothetical protein
MSIPLIRVWAVKGTARVDQPAEQLDQADGQQEGRQQDGDETHVVHWCSEPFRLEHGGGEIDEHGDRDGEQDVLHYIHDPSL